MLEFLWLTPRNVDAFYWSKYQDVKCRDVRNHCLHTCSSFWVCNWNKLKSKMRISRTLCETHEKLFNIFFLWPDSLLNLRHQTNCILVHCIHCKAHCRTKTKYRSWNVNKKTFNAQSFICINLTYAVNSLKICLLITARLHHMIYLKYWDLLFLGKVKSQQSQLQGD